MLNKLLYRLTAGLPCRIIDIEGKPYLERYALGCLFGVTFYLHRFVGQDEERHVHDHPWRWARAIVLKGGYVEEVVTALDLSKGWISKFRRVRWYNDLGPHVFHRIVKPVPGTWTLFFHGKRFKSWGFLRIKLLAPPPGYAEWKSVEYYQPYDVTKNSGWEKKVPIGKDAGREPL